NARSGARTVSGSVARTNPASLVTIPRPVRSTKPPRRTARRATREPCSGVAGGSRTRDPRTSSSRVENHVILLLWRHPVLRTRLLPNSGNSAPSVTTSRTEGTGGQTGKGADHGRSGHGAQRHLGPAGRPADGRERGRAPLPPEEARGRARARRPRASADGHGRLRGRDPGDPRGRRGRASDRRGPADAGPPSL